GRLGIVHRRGRGDRIPVGLESYRQRVPHHLVILHNEDATRSLHHPSPSMPGRPGPRAPRARVTLHSTPAGPQVPGLCLVNRACRVILLEVSQASIPSCCRCTFLYVGSVLSLLPIPYWVNSTKSRMNLFRLKERIDLGPAISSVCQRRSLGLLNWYR